MNFLIFRGLKLRTGAGGLLPGESYSQVLGTRTSALLTDSAASTGSKKTIKKLFSFKTTVMFESDAN